MGYELDAGTINWATKRVDDLICAEFNVGAAMERVDLAVMAFKEAAEQIQDQPESEMIKAVAWIIENANSQLKERVTEFSADRIELGKAIIKFREGGETDDT